MTQRTTWITIVVIIALYLSVAAFVSVPSSTEYPAATSYSTESNGLHALYSLFQKLPAAGDVRIVYEPQTVPYPVAALLMVQPQTNLSPRLAQDWLQEAYSGKHILFLTQTQDALLQAMHLRIYNVLATTHVKVHYRLTQGVFSSNIAYAGPVAGLKGYDHHDQLWVLCKGSQTYTAGVTRHLGKGSITVLTLPQIAYNDTVAHSDNLAVFLHVLQPWHNTIGFVETIHGYASTPGVTAVFGSGFTAFLWLTLAAVVLFVWSQGRRLGIVRDTVEIPSVASLAFAKALAKHQKKSKQWTALALQLQSLAVLRTGLTPMSDRKIRMTKQAYLDTAVRLTRHLKDYNQPRKKG